MRSLALSSLRERGFASDWNSPASAFRANTIRFCTDLRPPDQQSAKSPAARSPQHSSAQSRWAMFNPNSLNREPSYSSTSAAKPSRPASSSCRFIAVKLNDRDFVMKPEQLLYAKTHEWVAVEPDSS